MTDYTHQITTTIGLAAGATGSGGGGGGIGSTSGSLTSTLVPDRLPVGLAGHAYMLDRTTDQTGLRGQYFREDTVNLLRTQADNSNQPDEGSINPASLWRRSQRSWTHGAGQAYFDSKTSDPDRFHTSKGVDVWTERQISPLPDVKISQSLAAGVEGRLATAGNYLYLLTSTSLAYTTDLSSWTSGSVTGGTGITSDGNTVYVGTTGGVFTCTRGSATLAAFGTWTSSIDLVSYVKTRLLVGYGPALANLIAAPAGAPTPLLTHPNTDWRWTSTADAVDQIYVAGYSGDYSAVYQTTILADGTALAVPVQSVAMPRGEIVYSMLGYQGLVVLGTSLGVRIAQPDSAGVLSFGGLVPTTSPVRCLTAFGNFVYYGLEAYDAQSSGLGRLDLRTFTSALIPAYASDLMAPVEGGAAQQGTVISVATFASKPVFTVTGYGACYPDPSNTVVGTIDSGQISYDLVDPKIGLFLDIATKPLPNNASVVGLLAGDDGVFGAVGQEGDLEATSSTFILRQKVSTSFEHRLTLNNATLTHATLRAYPIPTRTFQWTLPLLVVEREDPYGGDDYYLDVVAETRFLRGLLNSQELVQLQIGGESYTVYVEDVTRIPRSQTQDRQSWNAVIVVVAKEVGL